MASYSMTIVNDKLPTRVTDATSTLIDIIFTNYLALPNLNSFSTFDTYISYQEMLLVNYKNVSRERFYI